MTTTYNVNIIGNLTNNDGVISGFSSDDYMTITNTAYIPQGRNWELVICITTGNDVSGSNMYAPNTWGSGVCIGITNGNFLYLVGDAGNGWLNPSAGYIATSYSVLPNTTYYLKVTCDIDNSGYYYFHYSLDGQDWVQLLRYSSTNTVAVIPIDLGVNFSGSIDLNKCYLKINDTIAWQGVTRQGATPKIQLRHDTAANWTSVNPVLLEGEVGIETDTRKQKFGDGVTAWNSLPYDKGSTALQSITSSNVTTALGYTPVNKAGDTMSGALTTTKLNISNINSGAISLKNITNGNYSDVTFYDDNDSRVGFVRGNNVSSTVNSIQISVVDNNNTVGGTLTLTNNNGTNSASINTTLTANNLISNGSLTTAGNINLGGSGRMNLKVNGTSKGTTPSSNCYQAFLFNDTDSSHTTWQSQRFGACETQVLNTGENRLVLSVYKNEANSTAGATLTLGMPSNGSAYCTFPNTTCCDGQWVNNSGQLASNVSLAVGSDQRLEYDISSYLPNDNYSYEVRFSIGAQTGSGSGAGLSISLIGKAYNNVDTWVRVCDMYARGSWAMVMGNSAIVPISTNRKVILHYSVISKAAQLNGLHIEAYRRIGTNA